MTGRKTFFRIFSITDIFSCCRISLTPGLHEIRHKTAVSTIRSLSEKQADRDLMRQKNDERRKKLARGTKCDTTVNTPGINVCNLIKYLSQDPNKIIL